MLRPCLEPPRAAPRPAPGRLAPVALRLVLLLALPVAGCHRSPEAAYWRDRPASPRPSPPVEMTVQWERSAVACPEQVALVDEERWLLLWTEAGSERLRLADGSPVADGPPVVAPAPEPPPRWEERTYETQEAAGIVTLPRGPGPGWTFRAAAAIVTPPQLHHGRLLIQSLDNYAYCLRPDNGHEIWRTRLTGRLTRPAAFWNDRTFLAPEGSAEVLAIDLFDGNRAGSWRLPDASPGRFVARPLVAGDLLVLVHAPYGATVCQAVALRLAAGQAAGASMDSPGGGS